MKFPGVAPGKPGEPNMPTVPFFLVVQEIRGQRVRSTIKPMTTPGSENSTTPLWQRVVDET